MTTNTKGAAMSNETVIDVEGREKVGPGTELAHVMSEGDPETMLIMLEKKAGIAIRMKQAVETIMVSQTYPQDWTIQGQGDKARACLSSAGAERIGRHFPIRYRNVAWKKEEWQDSHGKAYRYVYSGYADMYDREVYAEGSYSTRDEFLGKANKQWRPLEDINEGDIRSAAMHIFQGNAIKELLGLRGIPQAEFERIMGRTGQNAGAASTVNRGQGTQGGTSAGDGAHQKELAEICIAIANAGQVAEPTEDGKGFMLMPMGESDDRTDIERAKAICVTLSSFWSEKDKKRVSGKPASELKGRWLDATLAKARELKAKL